jgi:hypothetical protein
MITCLCVVYNRQLFGRAFLEPAASDCAREGAISKARMEKLYSTFVVYGHVGGDVL